MGVDRPLLTGRTTAGAGMTEEAGETVAEDEASGTGETRAAEIEVGAIMTGEIVIIEDIEVDRRIEDGDRPRKTSE